MCNHLARCIAFSVLFRGPSFQPRPPSLPPPRPGEKNEKSTGTRAGLFLGSVFDPPVYREKDLFKDDFYSCSPTCRHHGTCQENVVSVQWGPWREAQSPDGFGVATLNVFMKNIWPDGNVMLSNLPWDDTCASWFQRRQKSPGPKSNL